MYIENKTSLIVLNRALKNEVVRIKQLMVTADEVMRMQYNLQLEHIENMIMRSSIAIDKFNPTKPLES